MQWYDQVMDTAENGDHIFDVMALKDPLATPKVWTKIAEIYLASDMYTSLFGDERLFFRHQQVKFDAKYWPKALRKAWFGGQIDPIRKREGDHVWNRPSPPGWPSDDNCEAR